MPASDQLTTYKTALKQCHKVGTAHASGDALRAMYANLIAGMHGGSAEKYFAHLQKHAAHDPGIIDEARSILRNRETAWNILLA
jgi:hypothetical protein